MPLVASVLQAGLEQLFASPEDTAEQCAQKWADAMQSYAGAVIPPSTSVVAAAATLSASLATAFSAHEAPFGISAMESAFTTFGATLGGGMVGYVAAPPAGPVGLGPQLGSHPPSHSAAATAIAGLVDAWMRTGTATLIAPPNTVLTWS